MRAACHQGVKSPSAHGSPVSLTGVPACAEGARGLAGGGLGRHGGNAWISRVRSGAPCRFESRPRVPLKTRQRRHDAVPSAPGHDDETVGGTGHESASSVHVGGHAEESVPYVEGWRVRSSSRRMWRCHGAHVWARGRVADLRRGPSVNSGHDKRADAAMAATRLNGMIQRTAALTRDAPLS